MPSRGAGTNGQSTVELALCLPILAFVLGAVLEVGLIAGDQVRVWRAARDAARVAAVDPDSAAIEEAAADSGLEGLEVAVEPEATYRVQGEPVTVAVAYRVRGHVPVVGELFDEVVLRATAAMRIEEP